MRTYTLQNLQPSGDTFALMYQNNAIVHSCGPLNQTEVDYITEDPARLADLEYDDNEDTPEWLNAQQWGYPHIRFASL